MALLLKRRNRQFEPLRKAIKAEGFQDALEARQIAVIRAAADRRVQGLGPSSRDATDRRRASAASLQTEELPERSPRTAEDMAVDCLRPSSPNGRSARTLVKRQAAEQKRLQRQQQLAEIEASKTRERVERIAARESEWQKAEVERKRKQERILLERDKEVQQLDEVQRELHTVEEELASMNEEKAALVSKLKQVLHVDDAAKLRTATLSPADEAVPMSLG